MNLGSTPVDKQGKTPLDYVPNIIEAFNRIKKGSNYYRRILVQKKAYGTNNIQNEDGKETEYNP